MLCGWLLHCERSWLCISRGLVSCIAARRFSRYMVASCCLAFAVRRVLKEGMHRDPGTTRHVCFQCFLREQVSRRTCESCREPKRKGKGFALNTFHMQAAIAP